MDVSPNERSGSFPHPKTYSKGSLPRYSTPPLEGSYFPPGLKRDPKVSTTAKMVAALLGDVRDELDADQLFRTRAVFNPPTVDELAGFLGVKRRWIFSAIAELREAEYLVVTRRQSRRPVYLFRAPQMLLFSSPGVHSAAPLGRNPEVHSAAPLDPPEVHSAAPLDPPEVHSAAPLDRNPEVHSAAPLGASEVHSAAPVRARPSSSSSSFSKYKNDDENPEVHSAAPLAAPPSLLEKHGLTSEQAAEISALRTPEQIAEQVAALPYRGKPGRPIKNPAAMLYQALRHGWAAPDSFLRDRELAAGRAAAAAALEIRERTAIEAKRAAIAEPVAIAEDTTTPGEPVDTRAGLPESLRRRLEVAR